MYRFLMVKLLAQLEGIGFVAVLGRSEFPGSAAALVSVEVFMERKASLQADVKAEMVCVGKEAQRL